MRPQPGTDEAVRAAVKRARSVLRELQHELAAFEERHELESRGIGYHPVHEDEEDGKDA